MPASHYLDYNATTPLRAEAWEAMQEYAHVPLNASSTHRFGRKAKHILETARATIAQTVNIGLTGTPSAHIIFTSSGTEANNLALKAINQAQIITCTTEHPSIYKTATQQSSHHIIDVDHKGVIRLDLLEKAFISCNTDRPIIVSVMAANNETGILQPLEDIIALAKRYNALVHSDAVQIFGKLPIDMSALDIDMLTISSHKIGGPQGAAALLIRKNIPYDIHAQHAGGGQEFGYRGGTENILAIHGFATAAQQAINNLSSTTQHMQELRDRLEQSLIAIAPDAIIIGQNTARLPNTSNICLPGVKSETQLIHCDLAGIAVSAGSACSSGKVESSHILQAMGYEKAIAACALRVSVGYNSTQADIDAFVACWKTLYEGMDRG